MAIFARKSFYDGPFPSDDLFGWRDLDPKPHPPIPNPDANSTVAQATAVIAASSHGFSQTGAIYLRAGDVIDAKTLPTVAQSTQDSASVFLFALNGPTPDFAKHPIEVAFLPDGGPYGDKNLLAILPVQGIPLKPHQTYAAVVTHRVKYASGLTPAVAPFIQHLQELRAAGQSEQPNAYSVWNAAPDILLAADVVAFSIFTTDDRAADMELFRADALAHHPVVPPPAVPTLTDTFDSYCVFQSTIQVPEYQHGTPPYYTDGGDWQRKDGLPSFDHLETARIWFTVPRSASPSGGFPTVFFIGTGAGGERGLVDRGVSKGNGFDGPIVPGSGPAMEFARVGWAGIQIDGTLEGIRNTTGGNEDFLLFNVSNIAALRDNIRQSALEIALLPDALKTYSFDASACPGAPKIFTMDSNKFALMGHSMGSSIAPLALSVQPLFKTAILSGAGGSFIHNIMDKQMPLPVKGVAEGLLGYAARGRELTKFDPALTLFQWAAEPADSPPYGYKIRTGDPHNILMLQGIVDHYILPSIAEATSLSLGLDFAGTPLDAQNAELNALGQPHIADLLPLTGHQILPLPASANVAGHTAILVQNPGDTVEDGHEVNFQTARPKSQYRCFLADVAAGKVPTVRDSSSEPCW